MPRVVLLLVIALCMTLAPVRLRGAESARGFSAGVEFRCGRCPHGRLCRGDNWLQQGDGVYRPRFPRDWPGLSERRPGKRRGAVADSYDDV